MNIAFCLYEGMTVLDFVGAYDPITRLDRMDFIPVDWDVCAPSGTVSADSLSLNVDRVEPDLGGYDLVFLPGGYGARDLCDDESFIEWLRTAKAATHLTSVCTGSLLLGAAGYLKGKQATTHPNAYEILAEYAEVVDRRVVHDGNVITARGVSSALDLGLYVVELLTEPETRNAIAKQMDYSYGATVFNNE